MHAEGSAALPPQLVSHPKSGRSWIRYALRHLDRAGDVEFHHDGFEYNDGSRPALPLDLEERCHRAQQAGRVVYLSREPRDVLVSGYFQITGRFADFFDFQGTISDYIRDPYFGAVPLHHFQSQWIEVCRRGLALHVTYEQCHLDLVGVLERVTRHFGWSLSRQQLADAARLSTFEQMREVEQRGDFPEPWLRLRNGAPKVRRGRVGGYVDHFDGPDLAYLDSVLGPVGTSVLARPS